MPLHEGGGVSPSLYFHVRLRIRKNFCFFRLDESTISGPSVLLRNIFSERHEANPTVAW